MVKLIRQILDLFYPLVRKIFDKTTYYYAACGTGNLVLSWILFFVFFQFVFQHIIQLIYYIMKNLDHYLEQAIGNIEEDRKITRELLDDVVRYLSKNEENHRSVGLTAAKYVETLQRSNAQLVSVATMIQKEQEKNADGLSEDDKADIFDMLQSGDEEDG